MQNGSGRAPCPTHSHVADQLHCPEHQVRLRDACARPACRTLGGGDEGLEDATVTVGGLWSRWRVEHLSPIPDSTVNCSPRFRNSRPIMHASLYTNLIDARIRLVINLCNQLITQRLMTSLAATNSQRVFPKGCVPSGPSPLGLVYELKSAII